MKTYQIATVSLFCSTLLLACSSSQKPCEDILEVKRQEQQCKEWRAVMVNNQYPQQALSARRNYEASCENLRYYRDEYDTICKGNETAIGEQKPKPKTP